MRVKPFAMSDASGVYFLLVAVKEPLVVKTRSNVFELSRAWYLYVGSDFTGSWARPRRHLLPAASKKLKWDIDWLLALTGPPEIRILPCSGKSAESQYALEWLGAADFPVTGRGIKTDRPRGFGSSDDKSAPTHLLGFKTKSKAQNFHLWRRAFMLKTARGVRNVAAAGGSGSVLSA
jgi:Uri superfamily endonuclease